MPSIKAEAARFKDIADGNQTVECAICREQRQKSQCGAQRRLFPFCRQAQSTSYCDTCMKTMLEHGIENFFGDFDRTSKCPCGKCVEEPNEDELPNLLSDASMRKLNKFRKNQKVNRDRFQMFCSTPDCEGVLHLPNNSMYMPLPSVRHQAALEVNTQADESVTHKATI